MAGQNIKNFFGSETIQIQCIANTSVSAKFALPGSILLPDCMVTNSGTTIAFIGFFSTIQNPAVPATATVPGSNGTINAIPVLPGAVYTFSKDEFGQGCDTVAAISTGTPLLYFTAGQGS